MNSIAHGFDLGAIMHQALLAQMQPTSAQPRVDMSAGFPRGDGSFADSVAGTSPQPERDLHFAMMANDSYTLNTNGVTGTQSERELQEAGWTRLTPAGNHLVDANGNQIPIHPSMLHDPKTGFDAAIFQNEAGQYVVAFRGTDTWSPGEGSDLNANLGQGAGFQTEQYQQAMELAELAMDTFQDGNVAFTGHSLGGGLASAAMLKVDAPGMTFNAAGLSDNTLREMGLNPNAIRREVADSGQIRRYNVEGDLLTGLQQGLPGINGMPDAVGHELRVAAPEGTSVNPITRHGGGGDGTAYVEALRDNPAYRPGNLDGTRVGLTWDALENISGLGLNLIGTLARNGISLVSDTASTVAGTVNDIGGVINDQFANGRPIDGTARIVGDVLDGAFDIGGHAVDNVADFAGDVVLDVTNFGGSVVRMVGDHVGWNAPFDALAGGVEWLGQRANDGLDWAGETLGQGLNVVGDGVEWVADAVGIAGQWTGDRIADGARWLGDRAVDTAELVVDGVQWTGERAVELAQWTGDRIVDGVEVVVDGAQWAGDRIVDGARAVGDGAKWVAEKINPFNWF